MLVNEFLEKSAESFPNKIALVFRSQRLAFRDVDLAANLFANALIEAGFRKQDRAVIYMDNSVESVISIFGILKAGGIFVIIDPQVKSKKLEFIINNCEASVLITSPVQLQRAFNANTSFPSLKWIILVDGEEAISINNKNRAVTLSYREIMKQSSVEKPASICIDVDLCSLIYTSGSTGTPKGVMLSHLNMVSAANSITQYLGNTDEDIIMNTLPLAFDYGLYQVIMAFKCGGTVVLEKNFVYPQQIINLVIQEKVTIWPMVPTIAALLLRLKEFRKIKLPDLKYITFTGQSMPPKHLTSLQAAFPNVQIFSMYGLTECKRVSYLPPAELERRPNSVGKAMPNTEVYLVDENDKQITEPWKTGELVLRGATVMKGYWNLPGETAKSLRSGRYPGDVVLYTGDLFQMDEEGYLYFLSRKDDIIKTSGYMLSPREVENILCEKDDVVEAAVIGVDDEILGKTITAFVQLTDESVTTEKEIIDFCSRRLEEYAVPKRVVLFSDLPKTGNGKISKSELHSYAIGETGGN